MQLVTVEKSVCLSCWRMGQLCKLLNILFHVNLMWYIYFEKDEIHLTIFPFHEELVWFPHEAYGLKSCSRKESRTYHQLIICFYALQHSSEPWWKDSYWCREAEQPARGAEATREGCLPVIYGVSTWNFGFSIWCWTHLVFSGQQGTSTSYNLEAAPPPLSVVINFHSELALSYVV